MKDCFTRLAEHALGFTTSVRPVTPSLYSPPACVAALLSPVEKESGRNLDGGIPQASGPFEASVEAEAGEFAAPESRPIELEPRVHKGNPRLSAIASPRVTSKESKEKEKDRLRLAPHDYIPDGAKRRETHFEDAGKQRAMPEATELEGSRRKPLSLQAPQRVKAIAVEVVEGPMVENVLHRQGSKAIASYTTIVPAALTRRRYLPEERKADEGVSPGSGGQQMSALRREIRPVTDSSHQELGPQPQTGLRIPRDGGLSSATEPSTIQVTIGRIEVRAVRLADSTREYAALPPPKLSLEEFLKRHNENSR